MGLLTGKTAFVSGGTRGIGLAIAERLAREGADVMVTGSSQSNCDAAVKRIASNSGGRVESYVLPTCEHLKGASLCSTRKVKLLILVIF